MRELSNIEIPAPKNTAYPWDDWMCGKPVAVKAGVDFSIQITSMCTQVHKKARELGYKCTIRVRGDEIFIIPKNDD